MTELPDAPWATKPDLPDAPWATKEPESDPVPQSFLHRIATGLMVGGSADASPEQLRQKGFEDFNIPANVAQAFKSGLERNKKQGPMSAADALMPGFEMVTSPLTAIFQAIGGAGEKATGGLLNSEAIQDALMLSDGAPARFSRVRNGVEQVVGELPKHEDFANAAAVLSPDEKGLRLVAAPEGGVYGPEQIKPGERYFKALDKDGKTAAEMLVKIDGTTAKVEDIMNPALPRTDGRNAIGTSQMRSLLRQFREQHPEVQEITGDRVSGARAAGGYDLDSEATTRLNLRDLWQERGIHPAEAVHDAQTDAFLKGDLTAKNLEPPDRSDIPPVQGTPAPQGTPRTQLAMTGEAHIDRILQSEPTKQVIDSPVVDREHTVPYTAGGSVPLDDPTVFIDRRFPKSFTIDGVTFDPADPFVVHENIEQHAMEMLIKGGMDDQIAYKVAHFEFAEKAEGAWYAAHGIDQAKAEAAYAPYMAEIQKAKAGNVPPNLYDRPYPHDAPSAAQHEAIAEPKPTAAEIAQAKAILAAQEPKESGFRPGGADVTRDMPNLTTQAPRAPGSLAGTARAAVDQLLGLARNIQGMVDPMATGSNRAMVIAKDAMNAVRRIRWEHFRKDLELQKNFGDPEQLTRMWNAADEESVAIQLGESREHQGLVTLESAERAMVERLQADAQAAWLHVKDVGMVEGDGLPAYTPRMVLNVGVHEAGGPQALNELGRNIFTRTSQMLRRKHMTAEETETSAKALVGDRMAKRGASVEEINAAMEKVQIARNIRALPLATARLEEAAVWHEMIKKVQDVGKSAGQDTVAVGFKPDNGWFTIAGNPAFTKWEPALEKNPVTGKYGARTDDAGNVLFVPKPIYMSGEFRGPMRSILDEGPSNYKVVQGGQSLYGALMAVKGKAMTAILNSPLIHNEVVWSKAMEAAGGKEWLGFGLYFRGNRIVNNPGRSSELIERGLNWMGPRGSIQDITGMTEEPSLKVGQSWTAKVLSFVPGLFDEGAGTAVKAAIDKAGNFWHNTLLWDRVRDLQFGLADHLSDRLVSKGTDRLTADRIATHFSNIIVGSIPKEAMSAGARATANMLLFSRSFTLGNLSTFKQAALGLPKPILAQIARDHGISAEAAIGEGAIETVKRTPQQIARGKAISTIMMSAGLYYVGNALIQHAFNVTAGDSTLESEMNGYARRYKSLMEDAGQGPFELRHLVSRLSPTYDNEPQKQDRAHIGYDKDGTAIYARNPTGKFGEEMVGYPTMPLEMLKRKLSPLAGGILETLENDKGFGRKIYDPNDTTLGGDVNSAFSIAKHLVMKHLPEGQINAGLDLLRGEGDKTTNELRLFGPAFGFTASVGAPGGPARGEQLSAKGAFESRFNIAWPDIRKQIQRGDVDGARDALKALGTPPGMEKGLIRSATNPAGTLHGRTLRDFYSYATDAQKQRLENAR